MHTQLHDFEQFMKRREDAASAYVKGDSHPLSQMVATISPATFFGPKGGFREGASNVASTYDHDATVFQPEGESSFDVLQSAASGDIAYWVGFQWVKARLKGSTTTVPMKLRVTEVFCHEEGEWKLVHRHADTLATEEKRK